jgi:hypothetical protein
MLLQVQQAELAASNQVLGRTHDALADALERQGDTRGAAAHARSAVQAVLAAYGEGSLQLAHQRLKLSAVLRGGGEHVEAQQAAALAEEALRAVAGPWHGEEPGP